MSKKLKDETDFDWNYLNDAEYVYEFLERQKRRDNKIGKEIKKNTIKKIKKNERKVDLSEVLLILQDTKEAYERVMNEKLKNKKSETYVKYRDRVYALSYCILLLEDMIDAKETK